jgi:hypothetical protein
LQITKYVRKGGLWMLDLVLLAILTPYVSDVWAYITSPTVALGFRVIIFVIGIVAFALFTFYLLMRRWGMLKSVQKETSVDVFSHSNLPTLEDIFAKVDRTIHLLGITLESLGSKIPLVENLLRNNKHVRILICDPKSKIMPAIESLVVSSNTSQRIDGTLGMLEQMRNTLSDTQKNNLEIKKYNEIPSHSMIIVDPDTSSAFMQVEPYAPMTAQQYRRIFKISQREQGNIFELYWNAYNSLWNHAESI